MTAMEKENTMAWDVDSDDDEFVVLMMDRGQGGRSLASRPQFQLAPTPHPAPTAHHLQMTMASKDEVDPETASVSARFVAGLESTALECV